jgi:hypothetical protein
LLTTDRSELIYDNLQFTISKLQLNSGLKKLRLPDKVESIQRAVPVLKLQADIIRHIPVHERSVSPEDSSLDRTAI